MIAWNDFSIILTKLTYMKTEPIKLISTDLSNFVIKNKLCVIKAGIADIANFNNTLNNQLNQVYKTALKIGFIDIDNLNYNDEFIQSIIDKQMINIGLNSSTSMLPGYYLFKDSLLVAYHPGTFDISKLDPNIQKASMWFGLALAVISGFAQKSFASGLLTFSATMEVPTGMNIFQFFKEILETKSEVEIRRKQSKVFLNEIDKGYAFLKVSKFASDEDVKKAWKNMLKEFHPDKSIEDKEARTKLCVSINEAYEIIVNHRKTFKKEHSFS